MTTSDPWTVRRLLEWTTAFFARKKVDAPRLSAELLLAHVLAVPRIKLYTDYERVLADKDLTTYRALVHRGSEHEPIAYLTRRAHFFNLEFDVEPGVLIPRPDTETLVENVLQLARNQAGFEAPRVLDLCTGSGCIAAAIASHLKNCVVVATDISDKAVAIARKNIEKLNLSDRVIVEQGDLFEPLANLADPRPFDLIVANPPYIPTAAIETLDKNVKDFETEAARRRARWLRHPPPHPRGRVHALNPNGRIFIEIQFDQGPASLEFASKAEGLTEVRILKDNAGHDRVLTARKA